MPGVNAGIFTTAFTGVPTTVSDCKPVPAFTWSIVTEPGPLITPNDTIPPGAKSPSVTVVLGVQVAAQRTLIKAAWKVACGSQSEINRLTLHRRSESYRYRIESSGHKWRNSNHRIGRRSDHRN